MDNRSVIKHRDQNQLGKERAYFILQFVLHYQESQGRNSRQELEDRN